MQQLAMFKIEVAYASNQRQFLIPLQVSQGATVLEAIKLSGIIESCPEIDLMHCKMGIYSRSVQANTVLQANDRIEIYRPLIVDPKVKRVMRAKLQK
jgi:putative ubiquitin-RnfH superfamily antitoxin RatB of RatAB toxin-antitoxin module